MGTNNGKYNSMDMTMKQFNKKGFTYLVTATILATIIIFVFLSTNRYTFQDKQDIYESRVKLMNDFVTDFNQDVHRATYISSFRALLSLEDYIASTSAGFFNNTATAFEEAFFNGTINQTNVTLMNASSFSDYLARVNFLASQIGLRANITVLNITLSQEDPWKITVAVHTKVNISDTKHVASWHFEKTYTTQVPIFDLRDPLYSKFTENTVPNTVREAPFLFLVNTSDNDTTNLQLLANKSYYIASTNAPSFLQHFENNNTPSPYGIQSIVNIGDIAAQDKDVYENRIKVDFIYFNDLGGVKLCNVTGLPASLYFVIPQNEATTYEVDGLSYSNASACP